MEGILEQMLNGVLWNESRRLGIVQIRNYNYVIVLGLIMLFILMP